MSGLIGEILVAMDSGAVAAGAAEIFEELQDLVRDHTDMRVVAVGTPGMCYADPQMQICVEGRPEVHFGNLTRATTRRLFADFVLNAKLPAGLPAERDFLMLGSRTVGHELTQEVSHILICNSDSEGAAALRTILPQLKSWTDNHAISLGVADDMGFYNRGLVLQFFPGAVTLTGVKAHEILATIKDAVERRKIEQRKIMRKPAQLRIASANCGLIDPEDIGAAIISGAYAALQSVLRDKSPTYVVQEILQSGLRGRGGAGYPTGKKWQLTAAEGGAEKYVICNGDEGDPGAFMDRSLLESDPHRVLEGLILAGYATGAREGYFYIRAEYPLAIRRVQKAVDDALSQGFLGENILGSQFSFDVRIRLGAGAYVCGEETALIASIEGKRGSPHSRPPYPSVQGLHQKPTCINNVETLASVPEILVRGGAWYATIGNGRSTGTKVFAVSGKIQRTQLVEVPMGVSVHSVVFDLCGGLAGERKIKAVQTGGPSGGMVPARLMETLLTYEAMAEVHAIIGSGGMIVLDETDDMVEFMRFYLNFNVDESCGKCAPCRAGGFQLLHLFNRLIERKATKADLGTIERVGRAMQAASLCGLGKSAPSPLFSTLKYFRHEYEAYLI